MSKQVRLRRGTAAEHETFTGAGAELTVDTTHDTIRVHDGVTPGGKVIGGQANTIADLRNFRPTVGRQTVELLGHTLAGIGGGTFYYDASDTMSADNNGTVIVTSGGERWKRSSKKIYSVDDFGADPLGISDSAPAINTASTTGFDLEGEGIYRLNSKITFSTANQIVNLKTVYPYFDGDVVEVNGLSSKVRVAVRGELDGSPTQPRIGALGGAIVLGAGGDNPQNASIANSTIRDIYGDGVVYEQGAMIDSTNVRIFITTRDGFRCTSNYGDNNHLLFSNTHVIGAAGIGYNLMAGAPFGSINLSRANVFLNAKAFNCGQNFFIGTIHNVGSIFSEQSGTPDEFGVDSRGNDIEVISDEVTFQGWVDNAPAYWMNTLRGYSNFDRMETINSVHHAITLNARLEGYQLYRQKAALTFENTITDTGGSVIVEHNKGSAGKRTDVFEDRIRLPGGLVISKTFKETTTLNFGAAVANGAAVTMPIINAAFGTSASFTANGIALPNGVLLSATIPASGGQLRVTVANLSGGVLDLSAVDVLWVLLYHFS